MSSRKFEFHGSIAAGVFDQQLWRLKKYTAVAMPCPGLLWTVREALACQTKTAVLPYCSIPCISPTIAIMMHKSTQFIVHYAVHFVQRPGSSSVLWDRS
jgi:hypothetical protein